MNLGDRFGRYTVLEKLGQGGMGEVYLALDSVLERRVALKILRADRHDEVARKRLVWEARFAASVDHPFVCKVYEAGEFDGAIFIAMEYVEGQTLAQRLVKGVLPWPEFRRIAGEVAEALAQAHSQGLVHRDVKPSNIMLTSSGHVKLLDFGLARRSLPDETETSTALTSPGTVIGTPLFMSPEQFRGKAVDSRSDMFTLGLVFFQCLTGTHPFRRSNSIATAMAIADDPTPPFVAASSGTPPGFEKLLARMLAKSPQERCSGGAELLEHLKRLDGKGSAESSPRRAAAPQSRPGSPANFVGRDAQRDSLWQAYARVRSGRGLLVSVSGEAGIGKTSLVEEFLAELQEGGDGPIVARGRCAEQLAGAEAWLPILEALSSLYHGEAEVSADEAMKTLAPTWRAQIASVESVAIDTVRLRELPAGSQERMKLELVALFRELSSFRPLVLFIEDVHWADISTVDILNYLASRFAEMRVLVLVTCRSAEMAAARHPFVAVSRGLQARGALTDLSLDFLSLADVERYLSLAYPGNTFPPSFAAMIHSRTEGSPLFAVDLIRYVQNAGGIREENGRWALSGSLPDSPRDLPESVRGMIGRKIEMLDPEDRKLLVAASVQGHEFDSAILADAAEMDTAEVEERLENLDLLHNFVRRGEEREFPDGTLSVTCRFVHVLYQNALYASLQPTRRVGLCGRAARSLVARYAGEIGPVAGRVALLFENARDFAEAASHFLVAARHAIELFGFREAISLADRGLSTLKTIAGKPEAMELELGLQMTKGVALRSATGWATPELEETFIRARAISRAMGDPPPTLPVLWAVSLFHLIRGNLIEARDHGDELIAKAGGDPDLLMAGHHMAGTSREFLGDMVESSRLLERARELHDPARQAVYNRLYGVECGILARSMSSRPMWALGYQDRALERARESANLSRPQRQPLSYSFALLVWEGILAYRGDAEEAIAVGDENIALCREHGMPQEAEWSRSFKGWALITVGKVSEGIDLLADSLSVQERIKTRLARSKFLALLAEGLGQVGRIEDGLKAIEEGLHYASWISEGGYVAELYRVRGKLLRSAGDLDAAGQALRRALDRAREQQAKSFELRAAADLASLLAQRGDGEAARALLQPVMDWFTEGFSTADWRHASQVLGEIG